MSYAYDIVQNSEPTSSKDGNLKSKSLSSTLFDAYNDSLDLGPLTAMKVFQAETSVRMNFLRKVYSLLTLQILVTCIVATLFMKVDFIQSYITNPDHSWLLFIVMIGTFPVIFGLMAFKDSHPLNLYLLFSFTIMESILVGYIITLYEERSVLMAAFITLSIFIALTLYTFQSKYDFSTLAATLFAFLWILILVSILQIFIRSELMEIMICIGGSLLFSGFIILDTHFLMHKLSPDDYIIATINLYLDLINLFLYILRMMKKKD